MHGIDTAAFARTPAWHRLGKVMPDLMSAKEAYEHAGLDWTVRVDPVFRKSQTGELVEVERTKVVIREDRNTVLGVVGNTFRPCQNSAWLDFLDAIIGEGAKIDAAGSLHGGKKVWFLCDLRSSFDVLPNDEIKSYGLFLNGHDGCTIGRVLPTKIRTVCQNTISLALQDAKDSKSKFDKGITIRHDGKVMDHVARAKMALGLIYSTSKMMELQAKALVARQVRTAELGQYLAKQVEMLKFSKEREKEVMGEMATLIDAETNSLPGMRGTLWQAYNVFSEWVDWSDRKIGADRRMDSNMLGKGNKLKVTAWENALALAH